MIIISHNGVVWDIKPIKITFAPKFKPNVKFSYSAWLILQFMEYDMLKPVVIIY
jgi:hypothetical protein